MTGWRPGVAEKLDHYVYLLIDPQSDRAFYVGKGSGGRCFAHIEEARRTSRDSVKDYPKLGTIRVVEAAGLGVRIEILRHHLTEAEAFHVEAAAIDLLGRRDLTNRVAGHGADDLGLMGIGDINALYGAVPVTIPPQHHVILIRVPRRYTRSMTSDDLYEATRRWWKLGVKRLKAEHVLAVVHGVVRAVYRIDGWEQPSAGDIAENPNRLGRWGFVGRPDAAMDDFYAFADVTGYLSVGARNPILYVNC